MLLNMTTKSNMTGQLRTNMSINSRDCVWMLMAFKRTNPTPLEKQTVMILKFLRALWHHSRTHAVLFTVYNRAVSSISESQYQEALRCLDKAEKLIGQHPEILLSRAYCFLRLGRYNECLKVALSSIEKVDARRTTYSDWDKNYLKFYASVCCAKASNYLGIDNPYDPGFMRKDIRLEKVRSYLKRNFPLREDR